MGAIDQPGLTVSGIPGQPRVQGLARDPELGRHHDLGFTTPDRKDGAIALLDNRHLHQSHSRSPHRPHRTAREKPIRPDVKHQVRPQRQASGGTTHADSALCCRIVLYGIKREVLSRLMFPIGGMRKADREQVHQHFLAADDAVLVATNACRLPA